MILNQFISTFAQVSPCITLAAVRSLKNYCIKYARIWVSLRAFLEPLYFFQKRIMFNDVAWGITNFEDTGDTVDLTEVWLKARDQEETRLLTLQSWANIFSVQKMSNLWGTLLMCTVLHKYTIPWKFNDLL